MFSGWLQKKMRTLSINELNSLAKMHQLYLNDDEARTLLNILHRTDIQLSSPKERKQLLSEIADKTSPKLAKQLEKLFIQFFG